MDVLVVGANGLLGSNVAASAVDRGAPVVGTYRTAAPDLPVAPAELDVRDADRFEQLLEEYGPDAVVNCAALTDVDGCERRETEAVAVNADAPGTMATVCRERGIRFVHVSTDYVFDGETDARYDESSTTNPLQAYGRTKLRGERAVLDADPDALVVRLSFLYGLHRSRGALEGFPAWVRDRIAAGEEVPLFVDQHVTPTRAGQAADALLDLLAGGYDGLYHVACRSCVTPRAFGTELCELLDAESSLIEEGRRDDIDRPARRPRHTCLDVTRLEETLGRTQPTLREDLDAIAESL